MVGSIRRLALWAGPLLFAGVLFYWPVARILAMGLGGDWVGVFSQPQVQQTIWFTIWQAVFSALLCLALGLPLAFLLYRRQFFGVKALRTFLVIPFVLPSIIVAIALSGLRDSLPESPILVILTAHIFLNLSLVVRVVGSAWAALDSSIEDAAAIDGAGALRVFFSVTLPSLRSAIMSAAILVFLFCATSFAIILVIGGGQIQSIETLSYQALNQYLDLETAAALSIAQTVISISAFALSRKYAAIEVRFESVDASDVQPSLKKSEWPVATFSFVIIGALFVIPISSVLVRAMTGESGISFDNFALLAGRGARDLLDITVLEALGNSLRNAAIASAIAFVVGTTVAWLLQGRRTWIAEFAFLLPLGVSPVVLGFGYLVSFGSGPLELRKSWLIVPLVQALIAMPIVIRMTQAALAGLGREPREASANAGASAWQTFRLVEAPMIRGTLVAAFGFALLASIGEFGSASLLAYGDQATLPLVLLRLISRPGEQNYSMAMAASALLVLLVFSLIGASELIRSRRQRS